MYSTTKQKCTLCGEIKDNIFFAPNHNRCGECEFNVSYYKLKLSWRTKLNEEENTVRLQESSLR